MGEKKRNEAMQYAIGTNSLEDVKLTKEEVEAIMKKVENGKRDKSFLFELLKELEKEKKAKLEEQNGRSRR